MLTSFTVSAGCSTVGFSVRVPNYTEDLDLSMDRQARQPSLEAWVACHVLPPRVRENEAYLTVLLLSRVITRLGSLQQVNAGTIEGMFASDLAFLQDLYRRINQEGTTRAAVSCPACQHEFAVDIGGAGLGGS